MATSPKQTMMTEKTNNEPPEGRTSGQSRWLTSDRNVLIGRLPDDFLRIDGQLPSSDNASNNCSTSSSSASPTRRQQIADDELAARALDQQQNGPFGMRTILSPGIPMPPIIGRLDLMVIEAKLVKNYGLTRMDPYVRIRFGMHQIYESQTAVNGGKNPRWNKRFHVFLPEGIDSFHLQIMDERTFYEDEEIAYLHYTIPADVFAGKTKEEWVDLQGRQGKEGVIGLVLHFTPLPPNCSSALINAGVHGIPIATAGTGATAAIGFTPAPVSLTPGATLPPVYAAPTPPPVEIKDEDVNQLRDMFPSVDTEVIRTLLETERGNKDRVINHLLQMSN